MDANNFQDGYPGKLVKVPEGVLAFVPNPLPPSTLHFSMELIGVLSEADRALGELRGIGKNLKNPYLLIGPLSSREAIMSSRLEGTIASAEELVIYDPVKNEQAQKSDVREVANYVRAMEVGLNLLNEIPISNRLIRKVHGRLLIGVRGQERSPGEFRREQNYIGSKGLPLQQMRFVPPPVNEMHQSLNEFEKYLHSDDKLPPLIRLAISHYQFEAIHPFSDGNGRVGRLLIILLLCAWDLLYEPLLYMSSYFERYKDTYKDSLLNISQKGAWDEWIFFFLRGVIDQSRDAIVRSKKLLQLHEKYRGIIQTGRSSALILKLIDELFILPRTSMARAVDLLDTTPRTAQKYINKLIDASILREITGQQRGRIYTAPEIIDIIQKDNIEED